MTIISEYWNKFQVSLFPRLETVLQEPLTEKLKRLIRILDVVEIERHIPSPFHQGMGRKQADRRPMARAFLAKAVYDYPTTEMLLENLRLQPTLRRLCGFEYQRDIPSVATFSRAFAEFALAGLGDIVHKALYIPVLSRRDNRRLRPIAKDFSPSPKGNILWRILN